MSNQLEWNCLQNRYRILIIKFRPPTTPQGKLQNGTESLIKLLIKQISFMFIYRFHRQPLSLSLLDLFIQYIEAIAEELNRSS